MNEKTGNLSVLLIYITAIIILTILQFLAISIYPDILKIDSLYITFSSISNLFLYGTLFLVFIIVFKKYFTYQIEYFKRHKNKILLIIVIGLVGLLVMSKLSIYIMYLLGVTEISENQEQHNMVFDGSLFDKVSLFIYVVLFAPLIEELVFRKAVLNIFHFDVKLEEGSKKYSQRKILHAAFAIIISGLLFGLIHVTSGDFVQIIYYAALGCILGIVYFVSNKNIVAPIAVHLLLNLLAVLDMIF